MSDEPLEPLDVGKGPESAQSAASSAQISDDWLRDFYKECGREVTLAYTTLNQMKNWAIVVQASIIAAVVSFGRSQPNPRDALVPIVAGALLAYVFTLRFFVRAILCYLNLLRWNTLQSAIVQFKLVPKDTATTQAELESNLRREINDYYHRWLAVVPRTSQLSSNLKLGFGLLLAIPATLFVGGVVMLWGDSLVRGMLLFAIGATAIEGLEFKRSAFFDTPANANRRTKVPKTFPDPEGSEGVILMWLLVLALSVGVMLGPWLDVAIRGLGPIPEVTRIR